MFLRKGLQHTLYQVNVLRKSFVLIVFFGTEDAFLSAKATVLADLSYCPLHSVYIVFVYHKPRALVKDLNTSTSFKGDKR